MRGLLEEERNKKKVIDTKMVMDSKDANINNDIFDDSNINNNIFDDSNINNNILDDSINDDSNINNDIENLDV